MYLRSLVLVRSQLKTHLALNQDQQFAEAIGFKQEPKDMSFGAGGVAQVV